MKKFLLITLTLYALGCDSGGGGGGSDPVGPSGSAPGISNLSYSPTTATVGQGGGAITLSVSLDFVDIDGDISTLSTYYEGKTITAPANSSGITAGKLMIMAGVYTTTAGAYPFQVWVTDSQGHNSNKLTGTFTVN